MDPSLLQILACPYCKKDLDLKIFKPEGEKIVDGSLRCTNCNRSFPIMDEIPILLPDEMRDKNKEQEFYSKYP